MNDYFKIIIMLLISFFICYFLCKKHIKIFNIQPKDQIEVKQLNPKHKFASCGGIDFIISTLIVFTIFSINEINKTFIILIFTMIYYGLIGFIDDYIKIRYQNNKGLSVFSRVVLEIIGVIIIISMFSIHLIEFIKFKNFYIYIGSFALIYSIICVLGCCNGVNLTDGLDGLATITYILAITPLFYISIKQENVITTYFITCLLGSLLAYLCFNFNPSKLIMGDVGSLSLGAIIAIIALSLNCEYILVISGAIYIIEALSVIIQVFYYKVSNGKRIFLMAPLHYHFIKKGMKESNVVLLFTIIGIILSFIATFIGVMV